jgi:hypothetical protein
MRHELPHLGNCPIDGVRAPPRGVFVNGYIGKTRVSWLSSAGILIHLDLFAIDLQIASRFARGGRQSKSATVDSIGRPTSDRANIGSI